MVDAGRFYLEKQNSGLSAVGKQAVTTGQPERDLVKPPSAAWVSGMWLLSIQGKDH
jgi:hypothetical protein